MLGTRILEERTSRYNGKIQVVRSLGFGTYVQVEGLTQSGGVVYGIWQSVFRKIKKQKLNIKNCLILGLGGGSAAKLVRKYWPEAKITGVEIDSVMVELGIRYLGLGDSRIKTIIGNAFNYPLSAVRYDLVIVDLYCGDRFPGKFETEKFLKKLTKNRLVLFSRLYFGEKRKEAVKFGSKLEKIFKKVEWFYPQANLMLFCYN